MLRAALAGANLAAATCIFSCKLSHSIRQRLTLGSRKAWLLCLIAFGLNFVEMARGAAILGRYTGTLHHDRNGKDQYAKLDFVTAQTENKQLRLMAVLSLYFGELGSSEYVSFHYDQVNYNLLTGELTFDQTDQDLNIKTHEFGQGTLRAQVRSALAGDIGELNLHNGDTTPLRLKSIIGGVAGEYRGICAGKAIQLQLQTLRSTQDTVRIGNPFCMYDIKGQLAVYDAKLCPNTAGRPCVTNQIYAGSYNFFTDSLNLFGTQRQYLCRVELDTSLNCDGCILKQNKRGARSPINPAWFKAPAETFPDGPALHGDTSSLAGNYKGYVYHEYLGVYQPASLNIITFQDATGGTLVFKMATVANLYFGEENSGESLTYHFESASYPLFSKQFLFQRASEDIDAILQVDHLGEGKVTGVWNSIHFGRVGPFILNKNQAVALPPGAKTMQSLSGTYESERMRLNLAVRLFQTPVNTENPYFPLTFSGYFVYRDQISSQFSIEGGSYDFYTGLIALPTNNEERTATGFVNTHNRNKLELFWPAKGFGRYLQDFKFNDFIEEKRLPFR